MSGATSRSRVRRGLYLALAWVALALGLIGIALPGLPTTPFILLSAWAAARGSDRMHRWLREHRLFGPMIGDWEKDRAVSRRAKLAATIAMLLSSGIFFLTAPKLWMAITGTAIMAVVAVWLWLRPEPRSKA